MHVRGCVCVVHEERGTVWQDLAKVYKSLANFRRFISHLIWQNAEPTLANSLHYWANFQCFKWPNIENNLTIWSHLRGRRFFSLVPFKLNSRYWSTSYLPTYLPSYAPNLIKDQSRVERVSILNWWQWWRLWNEVRACSIESDRWVRFFIFGDQSCLSEAATLSKEQDSNVINVISYSDSSSSNPCEKALKRI